MPNTLLIVTAGRMDVYLVAEENGQEMRQQFDKDSCAKLHSEIENSDTSRWQLVDAPKGKKRPAAKELPHGDFRLATPKLDAALKYCRDSSYGLTVTSALILDTCRKDSKSGTEPHYAAAILKRRLKDNLPSIDVEICHYLEDGKLEGSADSPDAIIRRDVVQVLDKSVRQAIEGTKHEVVVVCSTGGFDKVSRLVEDIVRLYAIDLEKIIALEIPETDGADTAIRKWSGPDPSEPYRLRRIALDLLNAGDLLGAYSTVKHLPESVYPWVKVLHGVYFFAAGLPLPEREQFGLTFFSWPAPFRVAVRAEFALRRDDIPSAVLLSVQFGEAALRQSLERDYLEKTTNESYEFKQSLEAGKQNAVNLLAGNGAEEKPFLRLSRNRFSYRLRRERTIAKDLFPKTSLECYLNATSQEAIRGLRNDVAHGEPSPRLMRRATQTMNKHGFWSASDPKFLNATLVQDLLRELVNGTQWERRLSCERLADHFLDEIRARVLGQT